MYDIPSGGGGSLTIYKHSILLQGGDSIPPSSCTIEVFLTTNTTVTNVIDAIRKSIIAPRFLWFDKDSPLLVYSESSITYPIWYINDVLSGEFTWAMISNTDLVVDSDTITPL